MPGDDPGDVGLPPGVDAVPRVEDLGKLAQEWPVLLDLASHTDLQMCFWGAGRLLFLIHRSDLLAERFDQVQIRLLST